MSRVIPNLQLFILLIFLSLVIFALDSIHFLDLPKRWGFYLTSPISFGVYRTYQNIDRQFDFIFAARFAAQENKALKVQVGHLLSENASLRKRLAETESLLAQQTSLDPQTYNLIAARPIGLGRYLKIDQGLDQGVQLGQAVVFKTNLIGRIFLVSPSSANIQLLADPDSKIAAFSQGLAGKAKGILVGQFGTQIVMDKILHEEKVTIGDLVYSEGTEGLLPRGLILGQVIEVSLKPNEVFKQAKVKPVFDITDLELVFVISE